MNQQIKNLKGMPDIYFEEVEFWQELENTANRIFKSYGYSEIRTPIVEETALFQRGIGEDTQVVSKEMYTFEDKSGDSVTLRPEGTASVVRSYIQNNLSARDEITKLYYKGPMYRYERPQKGRQRQFHQIGCEAFGTESPFLDAEQIILMDRLTRALGISRYEISLNSLGLKEERQKYLEDLVTYLKKYEKDLDEDSQRRLSTNPLRILDSKNAKVAEICREAPVILDALGDESKRHFEMVQGLLSKAGVEFNVNPHIVRGLDYYERTTFEFVSDELGAQSAFCGGGRYNQLVSELGGKPTPAVGWALGCERMILIMMATRTLRDTKKPGAYFVALDDMSFQKSFELMQGLRDEGVACESGYELKSMKSQMRRANKLGYKYAVIIGESELAKESVVLKDLEKGEQEEVAFTDLISKF